MLPSLIPPIPLKCPVLFLAAIFFPVTAVLLAVAAPLLATGAAYGIRAIALMALLALISLLGLLFLSRAAFFWSVDLHQLFGFDR